MNLHNTVEKMFRERRLPMTKIGYKILQNKILDAIDKNPQIVIQTQAATFSLLTLLIVMTAFAVGVTLGSSLEDIRMWIKTLTNSTMAC